MGSTESHLDNTISRNDGAMNKISISHKKGQSLVEFTLILPVFLLVLMGIFDMGRSIYYYSTIHNAARESARYGAVNYCDAAGIKTVASDMTEGLVDGLTISEPIVDYDVEGAPEYIVTKVQYKFQAITPMIGLFLGGDGSILLTSQSMNHIEQIKSCY